MDNVAGSGMTLTDRDRQVVVDVADWQVLTRQQLVTLGRFGSRTRANAVLLRLTRFGYLARRYQPTVAGTQRALYFPGPAAAELLHRPSDVLRRQGRMVRQMSDLFLAHQLLINEVRIAFISHAVTTVRWLAEADLRALSMGVVPDGCIEYGDPQQRFGAFLEVDRGTESLERWAAKVRQYLSLAASGRHRLALARQYFRVLVLCPSQERLANLRRTTATLTDRMFWFAVVSDVVAQSPFAAIWLRARGQDLHQITEP